MTEEVMEIQQRFRQRKEIYMIEVKHIGKDFVSPKKYPGLRGAVKGLFSNEKIVKKAEIGRASCRERV